MPLAAVSTVSTWDALTQAHHPYASFLAPGNIEKKEHMRVGVLVILACKPPFVEVLGREAEARCLGFCGTEQVELLGHR